MARQVLAGKLRGDRLAATENAIASGRTWLDEHYTPEDNYGGSKSWHYYALYGVERVATLLDLDQIGNRDWYSEGARWLLKNQSDDGAFGCAKPFGAGNFHGAQEESDTCFAILFLRRATRPTIATSNSAWTARGEIDPTETIRFRASGDSNTALYLDGVSDDFARENGGTIGLRVLRVEYMDGERVLAVVPGDPSRAYDADSFAARHEFVAPGEHTLRAVVTFVDPLAPFGAVKPEKRATSREVKVQSAGVLEPWMREAAVARERNLLRTASPRASSSSKLDGEEGEIALDGSEATRWVTKTDDAAPWIVIECAKAVKADTLVLTQGGAARDLTGRYDRIQSVEVRLNRDKEAVTFELPESELVPAVLPLGRLVAISRLEIRLTRRTPGTDWKGHAALAEIALERRGH
jgi:hypothetical protein